MKVRTQTLITIAALAPFVSLMAYGLVTSVIESYREYGALEATAMWFVVSWMTLGVLWWLGTR